MSTVPKLKNLHNGKIPFRISIGVTGHRSLPGNEAIVGRIREIFQTRFRQCYEPETFCALSETRETPIAFTVVTPLAEGADQLVSRVALETSAASLNVVLPFSESEYIKDFVLPESREIFEYLIQKADRRIVLGSGVTPVSEEERRQGYCAAGEYVVEHSDIMIAVWDGEPPRGKGGTGEIAKLALEKKKPVFIISPETPYEVTLKHGGALPSVGLREIEKFNSICIPEYAIAERVRKEFSALYDHPDSSEIAESLKQSVRERLLPRYARASMISERNQERYQQTGARCYFLSTLSVAVLAYTVVFLNQDSSSAYGFMFECILLTIILVVILIAYKKQVHRQWLENRALAERLRVAFYYVSCGIMPIPASKCPQPFLDDCSGWIGTAYEAIIGELPEFSELRNPETLVLIKYLRSCWIDPQMEYHERKSAKIARRDRILKYAGITLFVTAIIFSITHILLAKFGHNLKKSEEWISVVAVTLPAAGTAVTGFRTLMEYSRISSRSRHMTAQLQRLADRSLTLSTRKELEAFLAETEELMLSESQDWVKLIRFADLEKIA